ncbi:hypothetical protein BDZ91DRAFT_802436 [Kalaharituber pfeilii]|nr:hypothetical protein BDZ91DRAFT_802436 [Kalaharituber pfeilii]
MFNYHSQAAPSYKIPPWTSTPSNEPPQPSWTNAPQANLALGSCAPPESTSSYTPILCITITRPDPTVLKLVFAGFPTPHLLPRFWVEQPTRRVVVVFRHSSFHKALLSEQARREAGGPVPEQYVYTSTRHEFQLPEEFNPQRWVWRKREQQPNGVHVLELMFYTSQD